jgi:hypothetical protein
MEENYTLCRICSFYFNPFSRKLLHCDISNQKYCTAFRYQSPYFYTFMEPRNRFQGINSASLCSLAGRYDNPIPTRFLAPIECLKIPAQDVEGALPAMRKRVKIGQGMESMRIKCD